MFHFAFITLLFLSTTASEQKSQDKFSKQLNKIISAVKVDLKSIQGNKKGVTITDTTYFSRFTLVGTTENEVHYLIENTGCGICFSFSATIKSFVIADDAKATVQLWKEKINTALGTHISPEEYRDENEGIINEGYAFSIHGVDVLVYSVELPNIDTHSVYLSILKSK
ncbi:MAG TPA: hypothetical protein VNS32_27200 [Flavisolibacter sp.]|nr:hypothetical protein [Flavisolibacter sp.]